MTGHLDPETIARLDAGDFRRRKTARLSAHLAGCRVCGAVRGDLARVSALLAGTTAPPIPDHLAARIQTALATEAAHRAWLDAGPAEGTAAISGRKSRRSVFSPPVLRTVAAAAAVAAIAAGSYAIINRTSPSPTVSAGIGAPTGPAAVPGPAPAPQQRQAGGASVAVGPELAYHRAGHQQSFIPVSTGTDFSPGRLGTQVDAELTSLGPGASRILSGAGAPTKRYGQRASGSAPAATGTSRATALPPPAAGQLSNTRFDQALEGCVSRIAAGGLVVLVDVARYAGRIATVVAVRPAFGLRINVWVVAAGCSARAADVIRHVLLPRG